MRPAAIALVLLLAASCTREQPPDAAYRAFARAAQERDGDKVWSMLSRSAQEKLDARAREAAARASGAVPASGRQLLLGNAVLLSRPLASVVLLRESPNRAVLRVEEEGRPPREVTMVREGGWRVELGD